MKFTHKVSTPYVPSFRTAKVDGMFDIPPSEELSMEWEVNFPIEDEEWQIGLIVGPSGVGKTTLAKQIFGDENYHYGYDWNAASVVDDFPKGLSIREITDAMSHVGFSSPPAWRKPFRVLSNGQQFRAEIARTLVDPEKELVVFDEFTSVVDRKVARFGCEAVQKHIRKNSKQFVAVTCHYDVIEWLRPDWVYQVDTDSFEWTRGRLRRPDISIEIFRCHHSAWRLFRGHHYLTEDINKSAHCFIALVDGEPAAFCAALKFPHPSVKNMWKSHRTVVLPDYQGIGIGTILNETVGQHYVDQGMRFTGVSSHPAMNHIRLRSPKWILTRLPGMAPKPGKTSKVTGQSVTRMTAAFEFVGSQGASEENIGG